MTDTPMTRIALDGVTLCYHDIGPKADAAPARTVLLVHGWGVESSLMLPVAERLAARGYRALVPDMPGFGQSPPPPMAWSVSDYAHLLALWLDRLALGPVCYIGHSFGGRLGLVLGAAHAACVDQLILVDSAGVPARRALWPTVRLRAYRAARTGLTRAGAGALAGRLAAWYGRRYGSADYQQTHGVMRETFVRVVSEDLRPIAARVARPVLLVWGSADEDTPLWQGETLEALIPDAGLVVYHGAGHYSYLERLDDFVRVSDHFFRQPAQHARAASAQNREHTI
jgi:pimeloyl-ACP methyl ester carboxylesterase